MKFWLTLAFVVLWIGVVFAAPRMTELDLCKQQLTLLHDRADAIDRAAALMQAEAEAQKVTLLEWLQMAQKGE